MCCVWQVPTANFAAREAESIAIVAQNAKVTYYPETLQILEGNPACKKVPHHKYKVVYVLAPDDSYVWRLKMFPLVLYDRWMRVIMVDGKTMDEIDIGGLEAGVTVCIMQNCAAPVLIRHFMWRDVGRRRGVFFRWALHQLLVCVAPVCLKLLACM